MPLICRGCARVNPQTALYCYHDGIAFEGNTGIKPVSAGAMPFPTPFIFPSGRSCRTFDELVLTCELHWDEAQDVLRRGYLEGFLGGLGRADLAMVARRAGQGADIDSGLEELLTRLPAVVRQPPRLEVRPGTINLGTPSRDRDHRASVLLVNVGMGLVHGTASSDCDWICVGDTAGSSSKVVQFRKEMRLPLLILGRCLRAGPQAIEGRVTVETNGGTVTFVVSANVPAVPFPDGVLAGATTPRQLAMKARQATREAAPFFARGAVKRWYESNGWIYPVEGPAPSGLAAIQQFFEALGLVKPPKVGISPQRLNLTGFAGTELSGEILASTNEKRIVYAHGISSAAWLEVGTPILDKTEARIPIRVPEIPNQPGQTLEASIDVTANGGQRFAVQVTLAISADMPDRRSRVFDSVPVPASTVADQTKPVQDIVPVREPAVASEPVREQVVAPVESQEEATPTTVYAWWHLMPLAFLLICLAGIGLRDLVLGATGKEEPRVVLKEPPLDSRPRIALTFHEKETRVRLGFAGLKPSGEADAVTTPAFREASMRFGLQVLDVANPTPAGPLKRLNYQVDGTSNNTIVRLDGKELIYGDRPFRRPDGTYVETVEDGTWVPGKQDVRLPATVQRAEGRTSQWEYSASQVEVTQTVEIVRGAQSNLFDTCLVRYRLHNKDSKPHNVGIRFLLDTYIGSNDGVPFLIPGDDTLCTTQRDFDKPSAVPAFIQAMELGDLKNPGTIAQIGLRLDGLEPPGRVTLGAWPNLELRKKEIPPRSRQEKTLWTVSVYDIHTLEDPDSAVTLYWQERLLAPGEKREVGFTYGLGAVSGSEGGGQLGITVGGAFTPSGIFTLTAYVSNPARGEKVTLELPQGFSLVDGVSTVTVPALASGAKSRISPVTWTVRGPTQEGDFTLKVSSSTGNEQAQAVRIRTRGIFGE